MASRLISVLLAAFLACQGNKVPPTNLEEGFGILMTSATCKMRNLYRGALRPGTQGDAGRPRAQSQATGLHLGK
eukprot:486765-Amorphochlora_amoeboformis.AAC.2